VPKQTATQTESESGLGSLKTWKKNYCAGSQARSHQFPVSGPILMEKAQQLANGLGVANF